MTLVRVDTRNTKSPHVRHLAVISRIKIPFSGRELGAEIAATLCGKYLRGFDNAENLSYLDTAGQIFSRPCNACGLTGEE